MSVNVLFLSNLPAQITSDELLSELQRKYPEVIKSPYPDRDITCIVFHDGNKTTAVVRGLNVDFERLLLTTRDFKLRRSDGQEMLVKFKPDAGEERDERGHLKTISMTVGGKREFDALVGKFHRKIPQIFNQEFLKEIDCRVLDMHEQTSLLLNRIRVKYSSFQLPGGFMYYIKDERKNCIEVFYYSLLEKLQALVFLNLNPVLNLKYGDTPPQFRSKELPYFLCNWNCNNRGLGMNGRPINVKDLTFNTGYIEFKEFNPEYLDLDKIQELSISSQCWRCKEPFKLLGVTLHLSTLVGQCHCNYLDEPLRENQRKAYMWPGDNFTKLTPASLSDFHTTSLNICHHPIKQIYLTPTEYADIIRPLIEEEWKYTAQQFKKDYKTTSATLMSELVGCTDNFDSEGSKKNLFVVKFLVTLKEKAFTIGNIAGVSKITAEWTDENGKQEVKTKVFKMEASAVEGMIIVVVQMERRIGKFPPASDTVVTLTPKPHKTEYNSLKAFLNKWQKFASEYQENLIKILLDSSIPPLVSKHERSWMLVPKEKAEISPLIKFKLNRIFGKLNPEQKMAFHNAEKYSISLLHGPPGTGKSFTISAISILLCKTEGIKILIAAPSNFAASNNANSLTTLLQQEQVPIKVLRIFAKSKEKALQNVESVDDDEKQFDTLHGKVREHELWLNDPEIMEDDMRKIKQCVIDGTEYLLATDLLEKLEQHEDEIARIIVQSYDIFVTTVGSLADHRISSWSKKCPIDTVILDESGQLSHPQTISLFGCNPRRVVFVGDNKQLSPTINSYSAAAAGLGISYLEMRCWTGDCLDEIVKCNLPPWTCLKIQHRMHADIRHIVSKLTYNGQLRDSSSITNRAQPVYYEGITHFMDERRVGIVDHQFKDSEVEKSYKNDKEAMAVVEFVKKLNKCGVSSNHITILTFYEAQRTLLNKLMKESKLISQVANVDAVQGREQEIIIISFVRSNEKNDIGFIKDLKRMNVALSRAKEYLFIFCNWEFLQKIHVDHVKELVRILKDSNVKVMKE